MSRPRPLYVLSETATTILYGVGHREAVDVLTTVRDSSTFEDDFATLGLTRVPVDTGEV